MFGYFFIMMVCWLGFSYITLNALTDAPEEADLQELALSVAVGFLMAAVWPISLAGVVIGQLLRAIRKW